MEKRKGLNMKAFQSCIVLFTIILLLVSCNATDHDKQALIEYTDKQAPIEYLDLSKEKEREYFFDDTAEEKFADQFQLLDISAHSIYIIDNILNISIQFDKSVARKDISNARNYFMRYAILKNYAYTGFPYQEIHDKNIFYDPAILRIFIDNNLVVYQKYNKNAKEFNYFDYYENTAINLAARDCQDKFVEKFINTINRQVKKPKDIQAIHPFKGNVLLLKISTKNKLEDNEIEPIKNLAASELAVNLESEAVKKSGSNTKYLGIVIELSAENEKYAEYTYSNGINKRWITENWMNFDFFKETINN